MTNGATTDVTVVAIDEMEPIHGGLARRARATLGVSGWGMQVLTLPPAWARTSAGRPMPAAAAPTPTAAVVLRKSLRESPCIRSSCLLRGEWSARPFLALAR